ncbi:HNH endonuclease [Cellulomonas soli]
MPRSRSGPHSWENVVAACRRCNHRKADHLLSELGWTLPFTPATPVASVLGASAQHDLLTEWEPYLGWLRPGSPRSRRRAPGRDRGVLSRIAQEDLRRWHRSAAEQA